MDRREPPSLSIPPRRVANPAVAPVDRDAPPRIRPLRDRSEVRRDTSILSGLGSVVLYLAIALGSIGAAVATFLTIAAPTDLVRDQIVAQIKARTGRTLALEGATSFKLFPRLVVTLENVSLSAPPGMQAAPLARIKQISAEIRVSPLFRREVIIRQLVLSEPVFEFVIDSAGRRSWDFAAVGAVDPSSEPVRVAQASARGSRNDGLPPELKDFVRNSSDPDKAGQVGGLGALQDLILVDTRIERGTFRYADLRAGTSREVGKVDLDVGLRSLQSPLEIKGSLTWQGEPILVEAKLTTLKSLIEGRAARLSGGLTGRTLKAAYDGHVVQRSALEFEGDLSASSESLRRTAALAGVSLPAAQGYGPASIKGAIKTAGTVLSLEPFEAMLDGASANGNISFDSGNARPSIKANIRISELDLNKYARTNGSGAEATRSIVNVPASAPLRVPPSARQISEPPRGIAKDMPPQSIDDLLQRDGGAGPQVRGFSQRVGWSSEPYPFAALGIFDAEAKLSIGKVLSGNIKVGTSQVVVALKSGQMRLTLDDAQLYDGRGRGFMTLDVNKTPAIGANLQLEGVSAQPLLKDAAGVDLLAGRGKLSLAVAAQGQSEKDIIETMNGRVDVAMTEGAIVGWNLEQIIRNLGQGQFSGFDRVESERTPFTEMNAIFQIESGVATNKDLRILGPSMRITGAGIVELPGRRLDYIVRPRLVSASAGQAQSGQAGDARGFEIPIRIQGPWDRPSYAPDVGAVMRDPDKVVDTVKQIGKQLKDSGTLDQAKRLLDQFLKR